MHPQKWSTPSWRSESTASLLAGERTQIDQHNVKLVKRTDTSESSQCRWSEVADCKRVEVQRVSLEAQLVEGQRKKSAMKWTASSKRKRERNPISKEPNEFFCNYCISFFFFLDGSPGAGGNGGGVEWEDRIGRLSCHRGLISRIRCCQTNTCYLWWLPCYNWRVFASFLAVPHNVIHATVDLGQIGWISNQPLERMAAGPFYTIEMIWPVLWRALSPLWTEGVKWFHGFWHVVLAWRAAYTNKNRLSLGSTEWKLVSILFGYGLKWLWQTTFPVMSERTLCSGS